jgi:serine/threonine-protein kinase HipA
MARKRLTQELYVYLNDILVGILMRKPSGNLVFTYDKDWLQQKLARPISLSMPLTDAPYHTAVVQNFFENLLPDNEMIRERIQARFHAESKKCFDLLSHIGSDCVGALRLLTEPQCMENRKIQAKPIDDATIATLLKNYKTAPLGMSKHSDFRISIAGAQEKTGLLRMNNQWYLPKATTPTSHIIKLPIGSIAHAGIDLTDSVENEWICLQILSAYGLKVNQASIIYFDDMKTLVVERFDRRWVDEGSWLIRLPQEDMCQALGKSSGLKYESDGGPGIIDVMKILQGAYHAQADRERFMKSVFLFWILGAIDGHAKNFSLIIEAGGQYRLTPLYDVMSAYPLAAKRELEWLDLKMAMALKSKNRHYHWHTIQKRHWLAMASTCQFPGKTMQTIMDEIRDDMHRVIDTVSQSLPDGFPDHIANPIFSTMRKIRDKL